MLHRTTKTEDQTKDQEGRAIALPNHQTGDRNCSIDIRKRHDHQKTCKAIGGAADCAKCATGFIVHRGWGWGRDLPKGKCDILAPMYTHTRKTFINKLNKSAPVHTRARWFMTQGRGAWAWDYCSASTKPPRDAASMRHSNSHTNGSHCHLTWRCLRRACA